VAGFTIDFGFGRNVIRGARNVTVNGKPFGFEVELGINHYRGTEVSCLDQLSLAIDGAPIAATDMLFCVNGKLVPLNRLSSMYEEYWAVLDTASLLVLNRSLAEGSHQIDVTCVVRFTKLGDGLFFSSDNSGSKRLELEAPRELAPYLGTQPRREVEGIEPAVSMYCYTLPFVTQADFGVEEIFAEIARLGISRVELVGAQTFRNYPSPLDNEVAEVLALADKYGIEIYSYGGYVESVRVGDRDYTHEETMADVLVDLMTAKRLGATVMREFFTAEMVPELVPLAEAFEITVVWEMHRPITPSSPSTQALIQALQQANSKWVGICPDFGVFIEQPAPAAYNNYVAQGARPDLLDYIIASRHAGLDRDEVTAQINAQGGGRGEAQAIDDWYGFMSFEPADLDGFKAMLPYCRYFHGKFYGIDEAGNDPMIPQEALLGAIAATGFNGVVLTEYEGWQFGLDDAAAQVPRHLQLERRILGRPSE
jgi:hypothetical protein